MPKFLDSPVWYDELGNEVSIQSYQLPSTSFSDTSGTAGSEVTISLERKLSRAGFGIISPQGVSGMMDAPLVLLGGYVTTGGLGYIYKGVVLRDFSSKAPSYYITTIG